MFPARRFNNYYPMQDIVVSPASRQQEQDRRRLHVAQETNCTNTEPRTH